MRYRRDLTPSATYFFTVVTFRRSRLFAQGENIEQLRAAFRDEKARRPFHIDAIVIKHGYVSRPSDLPEGHRGRTAASIVTSAKEFCRPIGADRPSRCWITSVTNKHHRLRLATANPTLTRVMLDCLKAGNPTSTVLPLLSLCPVAFIFVFWQMITATLLWLYYLGERLYTQ
jgi:hypothetical protein